jgi:hypothetical protein
MTAKRTPPTEDAARELAALRRAGRQAVRLATQAGVPAYALRGDEIVDVTRPKSDRKPIRRESR